MMSQEGRALLDIARGAVAERLGGPAQSVPNEPWLSTPRAAFVTVRKGPHLHGCIGTVEATRPLGSTIARNATLAAFDDPRSRPLRYTELDSVRFEISVLTPPQKMTFASEEDARKQLAKHHDGAILSDGYKRGVLLPQVWKTLPDPQAFFDALKQKAGIDGPLSSEATIERFQVESFAEPGYGDPEVSFESRSQR